MLTLSSDILVGQNDPYGLTVTTLSPDETDIFDRKSVEVTGRSTYDSRQCQPATGVWSHWKLEKG